MCYTNGPFLYVVFLTVINLYPFLMFFCCFFFYIRDVSFVCLYVLHMQLSCGIKSILTDLLIYLFLVRYVILTASSSVYSRSNVKECPQLLKSWIRPDCIESITVDVNTVAVCMYSSDLALI